MPAGVIGKIESLRVHSPRLAACAVIPADAGIQKPDWMPDQVRHDAEYPAACGEVVYSVGNFKKSYCFLEILFSASSSRMQHGLIFGGILRREFSP